LVGLFSYPKRKLRKMVSKGDYAEALEFGKSIEEKYSKDADFLFIMGSVYYILEDAEKAISYFERSLTHHPNDLEALVLKANVHVFLKEKDKALECVEKIFKIDPQHEQAHNILEGYENE